MMYTFGHMPYWGWGFGGGMMISLLVLWTIPWKGIALWRAARRDEFWWFVAILLLNTLGLLEIFYVLYWTERKPTHRRSEHHHDHKSDSGVV